MSVDPAVLAAIEAAVQADPQNAALRLHLGSLLHTAGRPADALAQALVVLAERPDDVAALRLAAESAAAAGEDERAAGYRRLAAALEHAPPTTTSEPGGPTPVTPAGEVPETADELLAAWEATPPPAEPELGALSRPRVRLADVGGMADVKARIELSFLGPVRNPELRLQFGKSLRGGLLLWGPPGCGKTYLARALAGELGASFYEIGLHDVLDMWIGSSERNLHAVFEVARSHTPCLLFFDELDALGHKRSNLGRSGAAMRGVVNQFLAELDGASADNEGVFVLAATNHPWDVDPALLRPGRFDRTVFVAPPDQAARAAILEVHLRGRPAERLDVERIAKASEGLSGADLALICEHATEQAMAASLAAQELRPIRQRDLEDGLRSTPSSIRTWLETARNYVQFANTTGTYDDLAAYLKRHRF